MQGRALRKGEIGPVSTGSTSGANGTRMAEVRVRLWDGQIKRVRRSAPTLTEARRRVGETAHELLGASLEIVPVATSALTLRHIVAARLERLAVEGSVRPQTRIEYRRVIRPLLEGHGNTLLSDITPSRMSKILNDVYAATPSQHRQAMVVLRGAYTDAVADEVVSRSPLTDLKAPPKPRPHPTALTDDEVETLLTALRTPRGQQKSRTPLYADVALLQLTIGARLGEICALRWQDITFDESGVTIALTGTVVDDVGPAHRQDEPKTSSGHRRVRIDNPRAVAMLQERYRAAHAQESVEGPQVFPAARQGWLHPHVVEQRWRRDLAGTPLGAAKVSTHVLRRTFVTTRVKAGATFEQVAKMAGHSDPSTTRRTYYAVYPEVIDLTQD